MTDPQIEIMSIATLLGLILIGVPIGYALMIAGVIGYASLASWDAAFSLLATEPANSMASVDLATVPLFLLMGTFATLAGFSTDVYNAIVAFFGHRRGGLAYATVGACAVFGVVCGSSTATAATFGRSALPEMIKRGYSNSFAAATIAAGGTLKALIPPSVVMILYSMITNVFIFDLFTAALVPALLTVALNIATIAMVSRLYPDSAPITPRVPWPERVEALKQALPALALIIAVFGGLYSGIFTVNEAASVAAVLSLVAAIMRGRINRGNFLVGLREAASSTAMLYMILIGAFVFGYFVTLARIPEEVGAFVDRLTISPLAIVFVMLAIYLLLGAILDEIAAVLITLPFILPVILKLGYDPIWWGVVSVVVIEVGMIIPPMGIIVFVLHGVARDIPIQTIYRGVFPFVVADIILLVLLATFPGIAMWLPRLISG